jgi:uncharacterized protein
MAVCIGPGGRRNPPLGVEETVGYEWKESDGRSGFSLQGVARTAIFARMKFSVADQSNGNTIHAYTDESVVVRGITFSSSLVIMPDRIISDWRPDCFQALDEADFTSLLELRPDLVVLGTGQQQRFPDPRLYRALIEAGIGIEIMTTPAACRTYNILTSEGRRVIGALLFS